jgi:hypothetical protein
MCIKLEINQGHSSNIEHFRKHSYTVLTNKGYFNVKPFYVYVPFNSNSSFQNFSALCIKHYL